jgi:hypothetical protein
MISSRDASAKDGIDYFFFSVDASVLTEVWERCRDGRKFRSCVVGRDDLLGFCEV